MKRFQYLRDPLFLCCCLLYAVNRWLVKPWFSFSFSQSWFNDLLLIPCALPPLLLLHRVFGWRNHDRMPTAAEIAAHFAGWALLFEVVGPKILPRATADPLDVVAYGVGAVVAFLWWNVDPTVRRANLSHEL